MALLEVRHVCLKFGQRVLLHDIGCTLPDLGIVALMGPGAAGKSSLLRCISGWQPSLPLQMSGQVLYRGEPISPSHHPAHVPQQVPISHHSVIEFIASALPDRSSLTQSQQWERVVGTAEDLGIPILGFSRTTNVSELPRVSIKLLTMLRAFLTDEPVILLDEPIAALQEVEQQLLNEVICKMGSERLIWFATHHQAGARAVSNRVMLLAAGQLIADMPAAEFFNGNTNEWVHNYLKTGGCALASIAVDQAEEEAEADENLDLEEELILIDDTEYLAEIAREQGDKLTSSQIPETADPVPDPPPSFTWHSTPQAQLALNAAARGPEGFAWLFPGKLAGCPAPGVFDSRERDLSLLKGVGITTLVNLTERASERPSGFGIEDVHFPIVDMETPELDAAQQLVAYVEHLFRQGKSVAYHCKAGMGRTGTLLVMHLIGRGMPFEDALAYARQKRRTWVQSEAQLRFLRSVPTGFLLGTNT